MNFKIDSRRAPQSRRTTSNRRGAFRRAVSASRCPECNAGIMKGISWIGLDYVTREWVHADCFKKRMAARQATSSPQAPPAS